MGKGFVLPLFACEEDATAKSTAPIPLDHHFSKTNDLKQPNTHDSKTINNATTSSSAFVMDDSKAIGNARTFRSTVLNDGVDLSTVQQPNQHSTTRSTVLNDGIGLSTAQQPNRHSTMEYTQQANIGMQPVVHIPVSDCVANEIKNQYNTVEYTQQANLGTQPAVHAPASGLRTNEMKNIATQPFTPQHSQHSTISGIIPSKIHKVLANGQIVSPTATNDRAIWTVAQPLTQNKMNASTGSLLMDQHTQTAPEMVMESANPPIESTTATIPIKEYAVGELASLIKQQLEHTWSYIRVKGEISGLKPNASGHIYFNLKDDKALLNVVCFRNFAERLDIKLAEGQEVTVGGKLSTYMGRSNYQLLAETVKYSGIGAILAQLAVLKAKLQQEGLFSPEHKLPLPTYPWHMGLITSATGAVIQDMRHRLEARFPARAKLYAVAVQGKEASEQIIRGLHYFQTHPVDVIIIARGGGSLEDLLPFSDEQLLREVYACKIPVISAIGHETDFPLLDWVADLRAPTPTAAIELSTPLASELCQHWQRQRQQLQQIVYQHSQTLQQRLIHLQGLIRTQGQYSAKRIEHLLALIAIGKNQFYQRLHQLSTYLTNTSTKISQVILARFNNYHQFLLKIRITAAIKSQLLQTIAVRISDYQNRKHNITQTLVQCHHNQDIQLLQYRKTLQLHMQQRWQQSLNHYQLQQQVLQQHNLQSMLDRGYSIIYDADNKQPLSSIADLAPDSEINIHYRNWCIRAKVMDLTKLFNDIES